MSKRLYALPTLVFVALATTGYAQESRTYYTTDVLGSPALATDANGNVIWSESYTPFGDRLTSSSASFDNNRWFTSAPQNPSSGLVDFGSRHYDPELGRFLGIDPVPVVASNSQTFNRYAYAYNNPFGYVDPDGNYARGEGWTDKQWNTFANVQRRVANAMRTRGQKLMVKADKWDTKGKAGGDDLRTVANHLIQGAAALDDDGSRGFYAHATTHADYQSIWRKGTGNAAAFVPKSDRFSMYVVVDSVGWKDVSHRKWIIGHESLHSFYVGLSDQHIVDVNKKEIFAYKYYKPENLKVYKQMKGTPQALQNPDHIMDYVY